MLCLSLSVSATVSCLVSRISLDARSFLPRLHSSVTCLVHGHSLRPRLFLSCHRSSSRAPPAPSQRARCPSQPSSNRTSSAPPRAGACGSHMDSYGLMPQLHGLVRIHRAEVRSQNERRSDLKTSGGQISKRAEIRSQNKPRSDLKRAEVRSQTSCRTELQSARAST